MAASLALAACGSAVPPRSFVGYPGAVNPPGASVTSPGVAGNGVPAGGGAALLTPTASAAVTIPGASGPPSSNPGAGGTSANGGGSGDGGGDGSGTTTTAGGPLAGVTPGSCAGLTNSTGINDSAITVANVSDLSGPVPGLFTSSEQATAAFAAYFNSSSSICGRKIKVVGLDSQTSAVGDQDAATTACSSAFAMVGSVSAYDSGGAQTVASCGIPEIRAISTNPQRYHSPVTFAADSINPNQVGTEPWRAVKSSTGNAFQKAAMLYLDNGAVVPNAIADQKTAESLGYQFVYSSSISIEAFNYTPYVSAMQQKGVTFVEYVGAYQYAVRLKQAMDNQNFRPVFFMDSVAYDPAFVASIGSNGQGTYAFTDAAMFEESARNPELQTYLTWLHRLYPSAQPSFFGEFSWAAMRLFVQLAAQLGGRLSRPNLITAIKGVHDYDGNGLVSTQDVGGKRTTGCDIEMQLENGTWVRRTPYPYVCASVYSTGG